MREIRLFLLRLRETIKASFGVQIQEIILLFSLTYSYRFRIVWSCNVGRKSSTPENFACTSERTFYRDSYTATSCSIPERAPIPAVFSCFGVSLLTSWCSPVERIPFWPLSAILLGGSQLAAGTWLCQISGVSRNRKSAGAAAHNDKLLVIGT